MDYDELALYCTSIPTTSSWRMTTIRHRTRTSRWTCRGLWLEPAVAMWRRHDQPSTFQVYFGRGASTSTAYLQALQKP